MQDSTTVKKENNNGNPKQLEWVNSLPLDDLKKAYYGSLYLTWTGHLFHLVSGIASLFVLVLVAENANSSEDQKTILWLLVSFLLLVISFSGTLNRFTGMARKIYKIIQTGIF